MITKEVQEKVIENMRRWQKMENASVAATGNIMERTRNPIVRLIMEIIQRDSQMHYRVQDMIAESLETNNLNISRDEFEEVWALIDRHIQLEKDSVEMAREASKALKGYNMVIQEYLLDYLLLDEKKHEIILDRLESLKEGLYAEN